MTGSGESGMADANGSGMADPGESKTAELDPDQVELLARVSDVLLWSSRGALVPSRLDGFAEWTQRAARARCRDLDHVAAALSAVDPADVEGSLRRLDAAAPDEFELISSIAVGAYTMHPDVMAAVGYPAPQRAPIPFDQSADELSSGILDPVLDSSRSRLRDVPE
jgi:hypothetical protein